VIDELSNAEYRCPGETYSISRSVHLARLSGYYSACRDCPKRDDTAGLSARQARRVAEAHLRQQELTSTIGSDGFRRVAINDMSPSAARAVAVEFARQLQGPIVFASDGRLSIAAIVAAMVEGIRWTGCEAIDLGAASAPCAELAIKESEAEGGIYLGNPSGAAHLLGIKFWAGTSRTDFTPTLDTNGMKPTQADRPARLFGPLRRVYAAEGYLDELRPAYHALRPLRFVLRCNCEPVAFYLNDLLQNVACRVIPAEPSGDLGPQVASVKAHFGVEITDDGENACVFDEQGQMVASNLLEKSIPAETDALCTLTHLLVLLSRGDRPFSAVLDRADATR
jgi:phosphomannomutase